MAGILTPNGERYIAENYVDNITGNQAITHALTHVEIGTGTTAAASSDTSIETPLAAGGRVAINSTTTESPGGNTVLRITAIFPAGFTTGTAISEAVWTTSDGSVIGGRTVFDTPENPPAGRPLTVTLNLPVNGV